jgi:IS30 family transposase
MLQVNPIPMFPPNPDLTAPDLNQLIYITPQGELKKELTAYLRQRKPRPKSRKLETEKRGTISDMISISQRPVEVEDRIIPGHWEGDLIVGKDHKSEIGTRV